jgi:hypothetical protein
MLFNETPASKGLSLTTPTASSILASCQHIIAPVRRIRISKPTTKKAIHNHIENIPNYIEKKTILKNNPN